MNLVFTAKKVDAFEKKKGMPLAGCLSGSEISALVEFIELGSENISRDRAYEIIDEERKNGKSTQTIQIAILEELENQGFLEKSLGMSQKVKAKLAELAGQDSLATTGEETKLSQLKLD